MAAQLGKPRLESQEFRNLAPDLVVAMQQMGRAVQGAGLPESLLELVKLRASQINGCTFCVQYHATLLRRLGESEDRLTLLAVWHDAPVFSAQERAALAWAEALTRVAQTRDVSDAVYAEASTAFTPAQLAALTGAVALINAWNRINVAYRCPPSVAAR